MDIHKNARTTPHSRAAIVERITRLGESVKGVARAVGICPMHVLPADAPHPGPPIAGDPMPDPADPGEFLDVQVEQLPGPGALVALHGHHGLEGAQSGQAPPRQVPGDRGAAQPQPLGDLGARPPLPAQPFDVLDQLGRRGAGHVLRPRRAIHQAVAGAGPRHPLPHGLASRLAYTEVLPDEQGSTVSAFLWRALAWYRRQGIRVRRVMTDNAFAYLGHSFTALCAVRGLRHLRTRPYTPRTNGKAERFIQTLLREWAYVRPYGSSRARHAVMPRWLHYYNWHRPHASLHGRPPISRVLAGDSLLGLHN